MSSKTATGSDTYKAIFSSLTRFLKLIFILLILFFLARYIILNIDKVYELADKFNFIYFFLSAVLIFFYMTLNALLWNYLLNSFNVIPGIPKVLWTFFLAMFGKYIPGKIWVAAMRVHNLQDSENSKKRILGSIALDHIYLFSSGLFFFLVTWSTNRGPIGQIVKTPFIFGAFFLSAVIIIRPNIIIGLFNTILKATGRDTVDISISTYDSLRFFFMYLSTWVFCSIGVWLVVYSVVPASPGLILKTGSAFAASYLIGLIILIAPGGIGVREGIFAFLLNTYFPDYVSVLLAFAVRLAFIAAEIIGISAVYIYRISQRKLKHQ